ncbi:Copper tolerance protein [Collimonas arenae]|uniref:Copper tolerance protein n=1 Tax=Collimonas arenae TaxID=279058 RepID=A0A0A1FD77_9BURK|nr:cupredoxin family protein [Collimonas arenae]AIY40767.1 Copper tolerance protein [Collimonas arenae]
MKTSLVISSLLSALLVVGNAAYADAGHRHSEAGPAQFGEPGKTAEATRTVKVDMNDSMRFTPANITVREGETIRFEVTNSGGLKHEMVMGSAAELAEHAALMRKMPEMEHADENQVTVAPGKSAELIWKFNSAGKIDFACLEPGHYEAGMKEQIVVTPAKTGA